MNLDNATEVVKQQKISRRRFENYFSYGSRLPKAFGTQRQEALFYGVIYHCTLKKILILTIIKLNFNKKQ